MHVILGKSFFHCVKRQVFVGLHVGFCDKTIAVDSLGLMQPQSDDSLLIYKLVRLGHQDTAEDIGNVSHIELVMEIHGSLSET